MIFMLLLATITAVVTFAFSMLPGASFLAFPTGVTTAVGTVGNWTGWALGLLGEDVRQALVSAAGTYVAVMVAFLLWDVLRSFTFPVVNKFLK